MPRCLFAIFRLLTNVNVYLIYVCPGFSCAARCPHLVLFSFSTSAAVQGDLATIPMLLPSSICFSLYLLFHSMVGRRFCPTCTLRLREVARVQCLRTEQNCLFLFAPLLFPHFFFRQMLRCGRSKSVEHLSVAVVSTQCWCWGLFFNVLTDDARHFNFCVCVSVCATYMCSNRCVCVALAMAAGSFTRMGKR